MKKVISVILAAILLMSVAMPMASAGSYEDNPIIKINGTSGTIYSAAGEQIYPFEDGVLMDAIMSKVNPLLEDFATGVLLGGNYQAWAEELYDAMAPLYAPVKLNENGEATDGSHCGWDYKTAWVNPKKSGYGPNDYHFQFDFRLSPIVVAEELKVYIDRVKAATGKSKVSIRSRCYGSNILSAYFAVYPEHAAQSISRVIYYEPSSVGVDFVGALFSGRVVAEDEALDNFVNFFFEYKDLIEDPVLNTFITSLVTLLNEIKLLGITGEAFTSIARTVCEYAVPMVCRDSFASWPAYWAMVGEEYYEDAIDFIYNTPELKEQYAGLIAKCDEYYNKVTLAFDEVCAANDKAGIVTSVIAKYNSANMPFCETAKSQGDGFTTVYKQTFGATAADYGKVLSDKYINSLETTAYLSPDRKIDASTAKYRDRTWFLKNIYHTDFPDAEDALFVAILKDGIDVFESEKYPQYLDYDEETDTLFPVTGLDEVPEKEQKGGLLAILMKWFTSLFNILTRLFNGELDFSSLFAKNEA